MAALFSEGRGWLALAPAVKEHFIQPMGYRSHRHHAMHTPPSMRFKLAPLWAGLSLLLVTGCDRTALEQAFAPDPQLVAESAAEDGIDDSGSESTAPGGTSGAGSATARTKAKPSSKQNQSGPGGGSNPRSATDGKLESEQPEGKQSETDKSNPDQPSPNARTDQQVDDSDEPARDRQTSASGNASSQTSRGDTNTNSGSVPAELESAVADVLALGVLTPPDQAAVGRDFEPNQVVTRGEFARWLLAANNALYRDRPAAQIRSATGNSEAVFKDVPTTNLNFPAIQGLAEAGIVPSSLSGAREQINFRPDAPLTREDMLLWKVPLDVRGTLPASNLEAVKEAWGFQDASKTSTPALRAVLADYGNGDQAVIRRVFGYTTLLQPQKSVTQAEAAAALGYFGSDGQGIFAGDVEVGDLGEVEGNENIGG